MSWFIAVIARIPTNFSAPFTVAVEARDLAHATDRLYSFTSAIKRIEMTKANIEWSRQQCDILSIGGVWAVPRSGLFFTKIGPDAMALTGRLEITREMARLGGGEDIPLLEELMPEWQQADFETIRDYFRAAGIEVEDQTKGKQ